MRVPIQKNQSDMDALFEETEALPGPMSTMTWDEIEEHTEGALRDPADEDDEDDEVDKAHTEIDMNDFKESTILKVDDDKRMVWGWASVASVRGKLVKDHQGDVVTADDLQETAHDFMRNHRVSARMHKKDGATVTQTGDVVDSVCLTKELQDTLGIDLEMEGWLIGVKIDCDETWAGVKDGTLRSFSIGGSAERVPFDEVEKYNPNHHPAGSSKGGQFAPKAGGGAGASGGSKASAGKPDYKQAEAEANKRYKSFHERLGFEYGANHRTRDARSELLGDMESRAYDTPELKQASAAFKAGKAWAEGKEGKPRAGIMGGEGLAGKESLRPKDKVRIARLDARQAYKDDLVKIARRAITQGEDASSVRTFAKEMKAHAITARKQGGMSYNDAYRRSLRTGFEATPSDASRPIKQMSQKIWSHYRLRSKDTPNSYGLRSGQTRNDG